MSVEGEEYERDEEETPEPQTQEEVEEPAEVGNILFPMVTRYPEATVSSHGYLRGHKDNIVNVSKSLFFLNPLHQFLQSRTNHLFPKIHKYLSSVFTPVLTTPRHQRDLPANQDHPPSLGQPQLALLVVITL